MYKNLRLWQEIEIITGQQVYQRAADFSGVISEKEALSVLEGRDMTGAGELADAVIDVCDKYGGEKHIPAPSDPVLARLVAFLYELKTIPWGRAEGPPAKEITAFQLAWKGWDGPPKMRCQEVLHRTFRNRFGPRAEEVEQAVHGAVRSARIWHHAAILTCDAYAMSLLVPGWCEPAKDIYAAEVAILRAGAVVVSNIVINSELRTLAVLW